MNTIKQHRTWFFQVAVVILVASAVVSIGCAGDQPTLVDSTPPAESVTLSEARIQGDSLIFGVANPNKEEVRVELKLNQALPEGVTLTYTDAAGMMQTLQKKEGTDNVYVLVVPPNGMIEIQSSAIPDTDGAEYAVTATTADTNGNSRTDETPVSRTLKPADTDPPDKPVELLEANTPGSGATLRFSVTNPNDEEVRVRLILQAEEGAAQPQLTVTGQTEALAREGNSYALSVAANETIQIQSNAIPHDVAYTVMATTADTRGNLHADTAQTSLMSLDATPPDKPATLSGDPMERISLRFRIENPNSEAVQVELAFKPELPPRTTLTYNDAGTTRMLSAPDPYIFSVPARDGAGNNGMVIVESSAITDDVEYTITATTIDTSTSRNSRSDTTSATLISGDATAPRHPVMLSDANNAGSGSALILRVANLNTEAIQLELTLNQALPNVTLTYLDAADNNKRKTLEPADVAKTVYPLLVPANTVILIQSEGAIDPGTRYTITTTTADTSGNRHADTTSVSLASLDATPPAQPVTLSGDPMAGVSLRFRVTNPNSEKVQVGLTFNPRLTGATLTVDGSSSTGSSLTGRSLSLPANGMAIIQSSTITAGTAYTITAITADTSQNRHADAARLSLTSGDITPPAASVTLSNANSAGSGTSLRFRVTNPNSEMVRARLTFATDLPDGTTLTYNDAGMTKILRAPSLYYEVSVPARDATGNGMVIVESSAIGANTDYTITATTSDTSGNFRTDNTPVSETFRSRDASPPGASVTLTDANTPGSGISLRFSITNTNTEQVQAQLTFDSDLPPGASLTYDKAGTMTTLNRPGPYTITVPANDGTRDGVVVVESSDIAANVEYDITALTYDMSQNRHAGTAELNDLRSADITPPTLPVMLSNANSAGSGASLRFSLPNLNIETVRVRLTFAPDLPGGTTLTYNEAGKTRTIRAPNPYLVSVPANTRVDVQSSDIAAGVTYAVTATTGDTSGNFLSAAAPTSFMSADITPPAASVTLTDANTPGSGTSLRFRVSNPNSDEEVRARLTFAPDLPGGTTLTYKEDDTNEEDDMNEEDDTMKTLTAPGPYVFSVPASGAIIVESSAIAASRMYTITATTGDTAENFRTDSTPVSRTLTSADITPPQSSVTFSEVSLDTANTPLAFDISNPNSEPVNVGIAFNPALTDSETLTVNGSALTKRGNSYPLSLTASGTSGSSAEIRITSSAISTDGGAYTITMNTADINGNARTRIRTILTDTYRDTADNPHSVTNISATIQGGISRGDTDYLAVTLDTSTGNNKFRVYSEGTTDTVVRVLMEDGTQLGSDDNSGFGNNFDLVTDIASSGTYYIEVTGKEDSTRGSYSLKLFFYNIPIDFSSVPVWTDTTQTSATFTATANKDGTIYWGAYPHTGGVAPARPVGNALTLLRGRATFRQGTHSIMTVTANTEATFTVSGLTADTTYDLYAFLDDDENPSVISTLEKVTFATTFYRDTNGVTIRCDGASAGDSGVVGETTYTKRATKADITEGNAATTCTSDITDMSNLFENSNTFNGNIRHWDTSDVTNMNNMLSGASAFTQDISIWNVSSVSSCSGFGITTNAPSFTSCTP